MVHLKRQIALLKGRLKRFENIERREKVKKVSKQSRHVARRRRMGRVRTIYRRARGGFRRRGGMGGIKSIFHKGALGVGGGVIAEEVANRIYPSAGPIAGYAGAYLAGRGTGIIAKIAFDMLTGKSSLGNIFGGMGGGASAPDSL